MRPINILLVEDVPSTGKQIAGMLADMGYGVRLSRTAEEGLAAFSKRSFDLVLSEAHLAVAEDGLNGLEMVRRMREADPSLASIVVISNGDQEIAVRAMECGIRNFLRKPFSRDQLRNQLEEVLAEREQFCQQRRLISDLLRLRSELQEQVISQNRQLRRTERYLQNLLDAVPLGILSTDSEGNLATINRKAQAMYRCEARTALGKNIALLFGGLPPQLKEERCLHRRQDGTPFPVLVRQREILDDQDRPIAHLYVVEDLSEVESLKEQLLYAEQLSVLGQMAPRIAHEFKTPLQLILGFAELAKEYLKDGDLERGRSTLASIPPAVQELIALVQQIANLGKPKKSLVAELDLAKELEKILKPMEQLGLFKHCCLERDFAPALPKIQGDPTQIEQVFRNLIVNAVQAMEGRERRVLSLNLKPGAGGRQVDCAIRDTGEGIPPENLEKIFQPFFTTKPQGKGTGLGLTIVKSILDRYGARLRVESRVGEGTCFYLSFPAMRS